jgi:hypothetical protein
MFVCACVCVCVSLSACLQEGTPCVLTSNTSSLVSLSRKMNRGLVTNAAEEELA